MVIVDWGFIDNAAGSNRLGDRKGKEPAISLEQNIYYIPDRNQTCIQNTCFLL